MGRGRIKAALALGELGSKEAQPAIIFYSGMKQSVLDELVKQHGAVGAIAKTNSSAAFLREFKRLSASALARTCRARS